MASKQGTPGLDTPEARRSRFRVLRGGAADQATPDVPHPADGTAKWIGEAPRPGLSFARARLRRLAVWAADIGEPRIAIRLSAYALILGEHPQHDGEICADLSRMAEKVSDQQLATELLALGMVLELDG